ncbi:hypothetical protein [Halarcobacter sp.]|uniref:hypothetical protein n=1 Tax=Halarcobacter sp. TaxID=2321133 RepID=UPI003B000C3B
MGYKIRIPKRDDNEYKEIEQFEEFELINNAFYEVGIRTNKFRELKRKYVYCRYLSNKINKKIKWDEPLENNQSEYFKNDEETTSFYIKKSPKENFEEAFKRYKKNSLKIQDNQQYKLLELDLENFKEKLKTIPFKNKELIEHYNLVLDYMYIIPEMIKKDLYIDFIAYYFKKENPSSESSTEYEESSATSLYIKREYRESYYIETIIDDDNDKITRNLYPLTKRKLLTDHVLRFSSNHLILHKQVIKFLEDFFKVIEVKIKKQTALADAFFCYDYYKSRLEEVEQENKKREKENSENIAIQEAEDNIKKIENDTYLSVHQKEKEKAQYNEVIREQELKLLNIPTINKNSKHYIFKETKFKKSGIPPGTAYNYYIWLKPYIDNNEYIKLINSEQLL